MSASSLRRESTNSLIIENSAKHRVWRVIKKMYEVSRSAVVLGEKSTTFSLEQGVAQGCSLSPVLFSVFIDDC